MTPGEITSVVEKIRKKYDEYINKYYRPRSLREAFEGRYIRALRAKLKTSVLQGTVGDKRHTSNEVRRETVYVFKAGLPVYELVSSAGEVYIMQSYSQIVDKNLSMAGLAGLGARLKLPAGWTYRVRTLDQDLVLEAQGLAHVIQDDLENTYQRM